MVGTFEQLRSLRTPVDWLGPETRLTRKTFRFVNVWVRAARKVGPAHFEKPPRHAGEAGKRKVNHIKHLKSFPMANRHGADAVVGAKNPFFICSFWNMG
jgi:hypothetical protein